MKAPVSMLAMLLLLVVPAGGAEREAEARAQAGAAAQKYLELRFRAAEWKAVADLVLWDEKPSGECLQAVTKYTLDRVRIKDRSTALVTVIFHNLGRYCPAPGVSLAPTFESAPHLEKAVVQLRKRGILWQVEKTNRPEPHVNWRVLHERLLERARDPQMPPDVAAQLREVARALEKTAAARGGANATRSAKP